MPHLRKIVIQDFRNIALQEMDFSPNVNCISGGNGEGKTNLLDAIWYLSMTKSAFSSSDQFNCRYGTRSMAISGRYAMENGTEARFSVRTGEHGKEMKRDDKPYRKFSEHIGTLPIVMVSPTDTSLVSESGEERRRFVNSVLSQLDPEYLSQVQQYLRLLSQRNSLLRAGKTDDSLMSTFEDRMEAVARPVYEKRKEFVGQLRPVVERYYEAISGGREKVGIDYRSDLGKSSLAAMLRENRDRDTALGYTRDGIQRDDFLFTMDSHPIRRCGSQGQQKSFLVAVKFAQYEIMKQACGYPPMLLLDDLFDKLDMKRVENLLQMVSGNEFGQIFITDSNKVRLRSIVDSITSDRAYFEAEGGVFTRIDE